jgi:hypothetical protein
MKDVAYRPHLSVPSRHLEARSETRCAESVRAVKLISAKYFRKVEMTQINGEPVCADYEARGRYSTCKTVGDQWGRLSNASTRR